jgi:CheY-like chemotaxis protein
MAGSRPDDATAISRRAALRHDLLNAVNVLAGAATGLVDGGLTDAQHGWLRMIQTATTRLQEVANNLDRYDGATLADGRQRFADLLSIAAARVAKPFDRTRLVSAIEAVAGKRPLRVLLVDDSPDLARLVETYLNRTGWTLEVVETGERAVSKATTEPYDVVLMDVDLPGLDGATAAHAIRAADLARGVPPTPIIAMTAFDPDSGEAGDTEDASAVSSTPTASHEGPILIAIDDPEIVPLVPDFLEMRRADVRAFRESLQAGAYAAIQFTAHKMKGTGHGYGFTAISRLGGELEVAAHRQDVAEMARLIDELDSYLSRVRVTAGAMPDPERSRAIPHADTD